METIKFGLIGKQDLALGRNTFEVTLADARVVSMDQINLDTFDKVISVEDNEEDAATEILELRHTLTSRTTNPAAAGIGAKLRFSAESVDETPADVATLEATLVDAAAGTEDSKFWVWLRTAGAALARKIGFNHISTGSVEIRGGNTGDIVLSLPTATDTLAGIAATQTLTNKTLTDSVHNAGSGSETLSPEGLINYDSTEAANSGSSETDLISYSLPANSLSANGKGLRIKVVGVTAANTNVKTIRLYFGASVMISNDVTTTPSNKAWEFEALVMRDASTTQEFVAKGTVGAANQTSVVSALAATVTGAITIKVTGQGTSDSDITAKFMTVEFIN